MSSIRGTENRKAVGERLRSERERIGLSQVAAAKELGVSREALRKYETGENVPGGEVLGLAMNLGIDVRYVLVWLRQGERGSGILQAGLERPDLAVMGVAEDGPIYADRRVHTLINRLSSEEVRAIAPILDALMGDPRLLGVASTWTAEQWAALVNLAEAFRR